jgi:hypothetical protein
MYIILIFKLFESRERGGKGGHQQDSPLWLKGKDKGFFF